MKCSPRPFLPTLLLACAAAGQDEGLLFHDLQVRVEPAAGTLAVTDTLTLPAASSELRFALHAALALDPPAEGLRLQHLDDAGDHAAYALRAAGGGDLPARITLRYRGAIGGELREQVQSHARSEQRTRGLVGSEGVFLAGSTAWVPRTGDGLLRFRLAVDLPAGWDAVSQGRRTRHEEVNGRRHVAWDSPHPTDEVYLVAGRFHEYTRAAGKVQAMAFLRRPDPQLAARYLEATARYLGEYGALIGAYPYAKFAVVENFWETGYGMPSFTLLGPHVLRLPFLLRSSFPHEILHCWWGNGVLVDARGGNWCEGLTAYLADHRIQEQDGHGADYRRQALEQFASFVRAGNDQPLRAFRGRHSTASQAVGYGKAMMVFHMLRRRIGEQAFRRGLRELYRRYCYRRASWDDLAAVFGEVAGRDLSAFFGQWLERPGAPRLAIASARVTGGPGSRVVEVALRQVQDAGPWQLLVPVRIELDGAPAVVRQLDLRAREQRYELPVAAAPKRLAVDPESDVFRQLDPSEVPATFGTLFGAERVTLVTPAGDGAARWRPLLAAWRRGSTDVRVVAADALRALPADRAVWVLGRDNPWATPIREAAKRLGAHFDGERFSFGDAVAPRQSHVLALTARHPADPELALGWLVAGDGAVAGLARKLPHYGRYSFAVFEGDAPAIVAKGRWPAHGGALERDLR